MKEEEKRIKCVILDDEKDAIEALSFSLSYYCPEVEILAACNTIDETIEKIKNLTPNVVFLDINIRGQLSFEIFKYFNPIPFHVIFVTAYDKFAIQAIKFSALDYLLKPVHKDELKVAVQKAIQMTTSRESLSLFEEQFNKKSLLNKIAINTGNKTYVVNVDDIIYCMADSNYTWVYLTSGEKHLASNYLIYFEELLPNEIFFRIHRSCLVNLNYVTSFSSGNNIAVVSNKHELNISFRRKALFAEKIKNRLK